MNIKKYVILFICCVSCAIICASEHPLASKDNKAYDAVSFLNQEGFNPKEKSNNFQLEEHFRFIARAEELYLKITETAEKARDFRATERERELIARINFYTENNI